MARFIPPHPKKGTREAREHMARLRAMRGKKRKNPGAKYHERAAREYGMMEQLAKKPALQDFFHGKAVAHMESGLAARSMRHNPGRKRLYAAQIGARNFVIVEARSKAEATKQGRVMQASAMIGPFDSSQALRESIRRGFQGSELSPMFLNNPGRRHGAFRSCVRQVGRKLKQRGIPGSAQKICGKALRPNKNPLAIYGLGNPGRKGGRVVGVIYNRVHEIRAEKTGGFKPGLYRHPFTKRSKVCMLALDNGDILIHSQTGARLWKEA